MYAESESVSTYLFLIVVAVYIALAVYVLESVIKLVMCLGYYIRILTWETLLS